MSVCKAKAHSGTALLNSVHCCFESCTAGNGIRGHRQCHRQQHLQLTLRLVALRVCRQRDDPRRANLRGGVSCKQL